MILIHESPVTAKFAKPLDWKLGRSEEKVDKELGDANLIWPEITLANVRSLRVMRVLENFFVKAYSQGYQLF